MEGWGLVEPRLSLQKLYGRAWPSKCDGVREQRYYSRVQQQGPGSGPRGSSIERSMEAGLPRHLSRASLGPLRLVQLCPAARTARSRTEQGRSAAVGGQRRESMTGRRTSGESLPVTPSSAWWDDAGRRTPYSRRAGNLHRADSQPPTPTLSPYPRPHETAPRPPQKPVSSGRPLLRATSLFFFYVMSAASVDAQPP